MPIRLTLHQDGSTTSRGIIRGHAVTIDRPTSKGGNDAGPMGGELLLAALAGCFASNLYAAITAREAQVSDVRVTVEGDLADALARFEEVRLHVDAACEDEALLAKLVTIAERGCIVANTLRGGTTLTLTSRPG